jgi:ribosomal protein S27AE
MSTKYCNTCATTKSVAEFGVRTASSDGLAAKCKPCQSSYDKSRLNDPERVFARKVYAKTAEGLEARARANRAWYARNPEKRRAHIYLNNALRSGKVIKQKCEKCGAKNAEAHHDDYAKPLDVRWLCGKHHRRRHKELALLGLSP